MPDHPFLDPAEATAALGLKIAAVFFRHARPIPEDDLKALLARVDAHLAEIKAALADNEFIDVQRAEQIAAACRTLVALCHPGNPEQVALVAGAVGYFLDPDDAGSDTDSVIGLEDDAQVVNFVIRQSGIPADLVPVEDEP